MLEIIPTTKNDPFVDRFMLLHYSQPAGFVGRQMFYQITYADEIYGCIAFGSATLHLPGRRVLGKLTNGMNNIFYHIRVPRHVEKYPLRNFTTKALLAAEAIAIKDWASRYGDKVTWLETLVELPRTGELYLKAGYVVVGTTKGFTCKRGGGQGVDGWGGSRRWNRTDLRPKLVLTKLLERGTK